MTERNVDVVVVGAGFSGLYLLHNFRQLGLSTQVYEAGDGVGGTWYWNRYPGARCDAESMAYSYSFDPELEQEWEWTERYATQPEILTYINHVADRFDLNRDIKLSTRVTGAEYQDKTQRWRVTTDQGDEVFARFCIMATGCLSTPQDPDIAGVNDFAGPSHMTGRWPHEGVDFTGKTVGIIGTGSSAIQAIPVIAEQAKHLTVFQRTPNFSVPAANAPLDPDWVKNYKKEYRKHRDDYKHGRVSSFGDLMIPAEFRKITEEMIAGKPLAEVNATLERFWAFGGARFLGTFIDTMVSEASNTVVADFVRNKISDTVEDPDIAAKLTPTSHPIGTKRICVDSDYFATYNRDNVTLVDIAVDPLQAITETGLKTSGAAYEFDILVLATGFDAMTGTLSRMNITGSGGRPLNDKWEAGPRTYLGLGIHEFPNLFLVTGPGSPSVLSNMIVSIEQHVDFITQMIKYMQDNQFGVFEADLAAEDAWVGHVNEVASATLFPKAGSWYMGANIPGKPRVFMPYAGGVGPYRALCNGVVEKGYEGFNFS
ncbi:MAG: cyclohexanone monooxygenase [Candidatus Azotimanducaceae bacterium]|jgi:cyclohexanone monooxygenase